MPLAPPRARLDLNAEIEKDGRSGYIISVKETHWFTVAPSVLKAIRDVPDMVIG